MSAPVFRNSGIDPRRLTTPASSHARRSDAHRLLVHGRLRPMDEDCPSRPTIGKAARRAEAAIVIAAWLAIAAVAALILVPGAIWLAAGLAAGAR